MGFSFSWNETVGHHATSLDLSRFGSNLPELTLEAQGEGGAEHRERSVPGKGWRGLHGGVCAHSIPSSPAFPAGTSAAPATLVIVGLGQGLVASQANSV